MFRLMHVRCHVKNKKSFEVKLTFSGSLFLVIFLLLESFSQAPGLYKGIVWQEGGNNKLLYCGVQDQYYTYTMT